MSDVCYFRVSTACQQHSGLSLEAQPAVVLRFLPKRTRDALAAKQTRGFQLGTPANLPDEAKLKGLAVRQTNA
jgi:hypothetical protein